MTKQQVLNTLNKNYSSSVAIRLFNFWQQYYNGDIVDKHIVNTSYGRTQIWRNKRDLKAVGISFNTKRVKSAKKINLKI